MTGVVIVDASLASKWVLSEPHRAEARSLLIDWELGQVLRLVPSLFLSELNTPLLKLRRQALITAAQARRALRDVLSVVTVQADDTGLAIRAFHIADALALRTAHDCLYAALAEQHAAELWTADRRFYEIARGQLPFVRWVGEVRLPA